MLVKLALNNMKKSIKDYLIYFVTLVLGVTVFYVFNAIDGQGILQGGSITKQAIVKDLMNVLSALSVFIAFVIAFLVAYANSFLMKRRHKEFAVYMLLGMSKKKISIMLVVETIIIGTISLVVGTIVGLLASQGASLLVTKIFEVKNANYTFTFSSKACIKTVVYFFVIYIAVMIMNIIILNTSKLIDLLKSGVKNQEIKLKNTKVCAIVFIVSVAALMWAHTRFANIMDIVKQSSYELIIAFIILVITSVTIFWSLSGMILFVFNNMKNMYYKGINSFIISQISSKINTTVIMMAVISTLLCITITLFPSSLAYKEAFVEEKKEILPVDITFWKPVAESYKELYGYSEERWANLNKTIEQEFIENGIDLNIKLKDKLLVNVYKSAEVTCDTTMQEFVPDYLKGYEEEIIGESEYNAIATLYGYKPIYLGPQGYACLANDPDLVKTRNKALKNGKTFSIAGVTYMPLYDHCIEGVLSLSFTKDNRGIIIVPDSAIGNLYLDSQVLAGNYNALTEEDKYAMDAEVADTFDADKLLCSWETRIQLYDFSVGETAIMIFVALYVGIIFILVSSAILAINELSDCSDNIDKYVILRKIGIEDKEINKVLFKQILLIFFVPFALAICNAIAGIKMISGALIMMTRSGSINGLGLKPMIITLIIIITLYGGYMYVTYISSKNIIKDKISL